MAKKIPMRRCVATNEICPKKELLRVVKDKEEYFVSPFDLTQDNFYTERKFRECVERFLNNGKPKLFKSPSEGNKIISLLNVSFSPE